MPQALFLAQRELYKNLPSCNPKWATAQLASGGLAFSFSPYFPVCIFVFSVLFFFLFFDYSC
jgi:hypothetical protein